MIIWAFYKDSYQLQSLIGEELKMKRYIPFFMIAFILFVALGDKVLSGELGESSAKTRIALNNFAINLFPTIKRPKNPNERTEKELVQVERTK